MFSLTHGFVVDGSTGVKLPYRWYGAGMGWVLVLAHMTDTLMGLPWSGTTG